MSDLMTIQPKGLTANPRRGYRFKDLAVAFAKRFPIGTTLTQDDFNKWVEEMANQWPDSVDELGLYKAPKDVATDSDAWKAHLHRRTELRYNINKAAEHPRMNDTGQANTSGPIKPFSIVVPKPGRLEVCSPEETIVRSNIPEAIDSLLRTKRRQLRFLQESVDYSILPPYMQAQLNTISDGIDTLGRVVAEMVIGQNKMIERFKDQLQKQVQEGTIRPVNGGIHALIARGLSTPE